MIWRSKERKLISVTRFEINQSQSYAQLSLMTRDRK